MSSDMEWRVDAALQQDAAEDDGETVFGYDIDHVTTAFSSAPDFDPVVSSPTATDAAAVGADGGVGVGETVANVADDAAGAQRVPSIYRQVSKSLSSSIRKLTHPSSGGPNPVNDSPGRADDSVEPSSKGLAAMSEEER